MVGAGQREACRGHFFAEQTRVSPQAIAQVCPLFNHLQHFDGGGHDGRRQRVGEQIRTGALAQPLNHLFARGGVAAGGAAQRFTQRAGDDIDAPHHIAVFVGAAAVFADEADGVGVIDHHQRIVFIRQVANALQVGDHAIHREHAVGGDQHVTRAGLASFFQTRLQLLHIVVGIAEALRFTQTHAVDDRGMVQGVGDNGVFRAEQRFKQAAVGVETGGVEDRVFHTEEIGQLLLQLLMRILGAADEAYRGHPETVAVHAGFRRGNQFRVVRQTQIVIGAEVNHVAVADGNVRLLRRGDDALFFEQPFGPSGLQIAS
ncbi:Uncharacterised protein [Klebsiella pneumoniae]|nr:Uncharacterised protein [Klebsiella pneumoniae]